MGPRTGRRPVNHATRADLVRRLRRRVQEISELIDALAAEPAPPPPRPASDEPAPWRERLWTVPPETLLRVHDVAEALDRSASWVYKRTYRGAADPLPAERLGSELVFRADALRAWIAETLGRTEAA